MSDFTIAGVMGWPVAHSRSPLLHGYWLQRYGIPGTYIPLKVAPAGLGEALRALPVLGFAGCNLTLPHKETALLHLDHIDAPASRIRSVNTVIVRADGTLEGRSTDGYGFLENLRQTMPGWAPPDRAALVLGAGGSARAIAAALSDAGVPLVHVANRTGDRASRLVADLGGSLRAIAWDEKTKILPGCGLLVNTTTQGMEGQPPLDLNLDGLPDDAIVSDIVYTPLETPLLRQARQRGLRTVDGLGMLLHQARPGFAAWFGTAPDVDAALRNLMAGSLRG